MDVHRPVRQDEDLDLIFTVRQLRKVSHVLTLQYDKAIYLLADTAFTRALIGKYIDVFDYPDGRIEIRAAGTTLPYVRYDRLPEIDQGAIVENKRLGHALQVADLVQQQRDNRRSQAAPARTNLGGPVSVGIYSAGYRLALEWLSSQTGVKFMIVPYKGGTRCLPT